MTGLSSTVGEHLQHVTTGQSGLRQDRPENLHVTYTDGHNFFRAAWGPKVKHQRRDQTANCWYGTISLEISMVTGIYLVRSTALGRGVHCPTW